MFFRGIRALNQTGACELPPLQAPVIYRGECIPIINRRIKKGMKKG
jgi:hypothetical protein